MERIPIRHINEAKKEPVFTENFNIRQIDGLLAEKDMVQQLHRHDFFYILALEKGTGKHEIDFSPFTVDNYTVFFMRPGQVHQLTLKTGSTGYLIHFGNEFQIAPNNQSTNLLRKASSINYYKLSYDGFKKLRNTLIYILQEYTDKQENYREVIKANMDVFFIELIRQSRISPSDSANLYILEQLDKFLELIQIHFNTKQVSQYADMLNISPYQLASITKQTLSKTCSEIINEQIVLEAKRYLLATSNQINQIAYHLGYEDVSYFIRFFKKHTGHSPETFRQNFK